MRNDGSENPCDLRVGELAVCEGAGDVVVGDDVLGEHAGGGEGDGGGDRETGTLEQGGETFVHGLLPKGVKEGLFKGCGGSQRGQGALQGAVGVAGFGEGVEAFRAGVDVGVEAGLFIGGEAAGEGGGEVVVDPGVVVVGR